MPTRPNASRPPLAEDVADALAFALRFQGRKRVQNADEIMPAIVAKRLVEHLERAGFVVRKRPLTAGARRPTGRGDEGRRLKDRRGRLVLCSARSTRAAHVVSRPYVKRAGDRYRSAGRFRSRRARGSRSSRRQTWRARNRPFGRGTRGIRNSRSAKRSGSITWHRNKGPRRRVYIAFTGRRMRWRCLRGCEFDALGGDAKRHGRPVKHVRENGRVRNVGTRQRNPLWPFLAYGALTLAVLAMSERPIDAKERQDPHRATAMSREPPDSEREIDRSRAAERGRGRQATSPWRFPWRGWKDISGALTRK